MGFTYHHARFVGFTGGASGKEPAWQCRRLKRCVFDPWVGKIPWRRAWQPTPISCLKNPHRQRSLVGYNPWGHRVRHDWSNLACIHIHVLYLVDSSYFFFFHLKSNIPELIRRSPDWNKHTLSMFHQQIFLHEIKQLISIYIVSQACGTGDNIKNYFWLHRRILSNIWRRANAYPSKTLKKLQRKEHLQTHSMRPPSPWCQNQKKTTQKKKTTGQYHWWT